MSIKTKRGRADRLKRAELPERGDRVVCDILGRREGEVVARESEGDYNNTPQYIYTVNIDDCGIWRVDETDVLGFA